MKDLESNELPLDAILDDTSSGFLKEILLVLLEVLLEEVITSPQHEYIEVYREQWRNLIGFQVYGFRIKHGKYAEKFPGTSLINLLNELGSRGWELVGSDNDGECDIYRFKRMKSNLSTRNLDTLFSIIDKLKSNLAKEECFQDGKQDNDVEENSNEPEENASDREECQKDAVADYRIEELQLSVRAYNCLKRAKINTVGDLLKQQEAVLEGKIENLGSKSVEEIIEALNQKLGLNLPFDHHE